MSCVHFTKDDRVKLSVLLEAKISIRQCAKQLGFSPPAVSEEIKRNGGRKKYNYYRAQKRCRVIRKNANQCHRKLGKNKELTNAIIKLLKEDWSPEQIVGRTLLELGYVLTSFTSIYNYINSRKELHYLLPRKCNKYRRTKAGNKRKKLREILNSKRLIDTRPKIVDTRNRIGDWEGDTVIGQEKTSRMLTNVERKSRYLLADILHKVSSESIRKLSVKLFKNISRFKKHTITYDNGTEFSDYECTEKQIKFKIYFAHAYHSWERGTNENTNGLIRRYFPKGTKFSNISSRQFKKVIERINHRPRKVLGYKTPYEVFHGVNIRTLI